MNTYSYDNLTLIGKGAIGRIYRIDDEKIIKVYNSITHEKLNEQKWLAREIFKSGVPTAISFETAMVDDKYGIVYELLNSKTVGQEVSAHPDRIESMGRDTVKLLKTIHSCKIDSPNAKNMKQITAG